MAASPPNREGDDQHAELCALRWLASATSSPSAKDIAFESIGAFHSKMSEDVFGLGELFRGREERYRYGNSTEDERGMRALVHLRWLEEQANSCVYSPDRRIALTTLAAGYMVRSEGSLFSQWIKPSESVEWVFNKLDSYGIGMDGDEDICELVWAGLFERSNQMPLECAPDGLLEAIRSGRAGGHATPCFLGHTVTMQDVIHEIERRRWPYHAKDRLQKWSWKCPEASMDGQCVTKWMNWCYLRVALIVGARVRARISAGLDVDDSCASEWEQEARAAFSVLVSAAKKIENTECIAKEADEKNGAKEAKAAGEEDSRAKRLEALDIKGHIEEWKEHRKRAFLRKVAKVRQRQEEEAAARDAAAQYRAEARSPLRWFAKWFLPQTGVTIDPAVEMELGESPRRDVTLGT